MQINKEIVWSGKAEQEVGKEKDTGIVRVKVNPKYYRPAEVVSPAPPPEGKDIGMFLLLQQFPTCFFILFFEKCEKKKYFFFKCKKKKEKKSSETHATIDFIFASNIYKPLPIRK